MVNKYARMVETMMDDIFGFCIVNARYKSVFVFSDFKMAECRWCLKVVRKLFLMIKNGPEFMVSQMHTLFNIVWHNFRASPCVFAGCGNKALIPLSHGLVSNCHRIHWCWPYTVLHNHWNPQWILNILLEKPLAGWTVPQLALPSVIQALHQQSYLCSRCPDGSWLGCKYQEESLQSNLNRIPAVMGFAWIRCTYSAWWWRRQSNMALDL